MARAGEFFALWNASCGPFPAVRTMDNIMRRQIEARLTEHPDLDYWREAITRMAASDFARSRGFFTFRWLIKCGENVEKIHAGTYDNRPSGIRAVPNEPNQVRDEQAALRAEARKIGSLIFTPVDRGDGRRLRRVDFSALAAAMDAAFDKFGIEVIRAFRDTVAEQKALGQVIFDANRLQEYLERERTKNTAMPPVSTAQDRRGADSRVTSHTEAWA